MFYKFKNNDYGNGVKLDVYEEKYSLVAASESEAGEVYNRWCFPSKWDKEAGKGFPSEKQIPMQIGGVDKKEMITMLKWFLNELDAPKDDIPY